MVVKGGEKRFLRAVGRLKHCECQSIVAGPILGQKQDRRPTRIACRSQFRLKTYSFAVTLASSSTTRLE